MRDELDVKKRQGRAKAAALASATAGIVQSAENLINTALVRATQQRTQQPALQPLGTGLDLQNGSLARLPRPPQGCLGRNLFLVFHTDQSKKMNC